MILGIGVDTVSIRDLYELRQRIGADRLQKMFTTAEWLAAPDSIQESTEYLATRFAAKEAVFKAVAHLLPEKHFDLHIVETLNHEDGSPYVHVTESLAAVMERAGIKSLLISITAEGNYATAFALAQSEGECEETL